MIRTKEGLRRLHLDTGTFIEVEKNLSNDYTKREVNKNKTLTINLNEK